MSREVVNQCLSFISYHWHLQDENKISFSNAVYLSPVIMSWIFLMDIRSDGLEKNERIFLIFISQEPSLWTFSLRIMNQFRTLFNCFEDVRRICTQLHTQVLFSFLPSSFCILFRVCLCIEIICFCFSNSSRQNAYWFEFCFL